MIAMPLTASEQLLLLPGRCGDLRGPLSEEAVH